MPKVKSIVYDDRTVVPVAGINTTLSEKVAADTNSTALDGRRIVEIVASADLNWIKGDEGDTLDPADTVGVGLGISLALGTSTGPFPILAGEVIRATAAFQLIVRDMD